MYHTTYQCHLISTNEPFAFLHLANMTHSSACIFLSGHLCVRQAEQTAAESENRPDAAPTRPEQPDDEFSNIASMWDRTAVDPEMQSTSALPTSGGRDLVASGSDARLEISSSSQHASNTFNETVAVDAARSTMLKSWRVNTELLLTILLARRYRDCEARQFLLSLRDRDEARTFEWIDFRQEPVFECLDL